MLYLKTEAERLGSLFSSCQHTPPPRFVERQIFLKGMEGILRGRQLLRDAGLRGNAGGVFLLHSVGEL